MANSDGALACPQCKCVAESDIVENDITHETSHYVCQECGHHFNVELSEELKWARREALDALTGLSGEYDCSPEDRRKSSAKYSRMEAFFDRVAELIGQGSASDS